MTQILIVFTSFGTLPLLMGRFRLKAWQAILICSALVHAVALRSGGTLLDALARTFSLNNLATVAAIFLIGILSGVMQACGLLDRAVEASKALVRNRKALIGLLPALIGLLSVPGGALLSSPFVGSLGEEMGVPPPRRAALNLTFRHVTMLLSPLSAYHLFIAAYVPGGYTLALIACLLPFAALMAYGSVRAYLPKSLPKAPASAAPARATAAGLLAGLSPILGIFLLTGAFGVDKLIAIPSAILLVWALSRDREFPRKLVKAARLDVVLTVAAVFFAQQTIASLSSIREFVAGVFAGGQPLAVMAVVILGSVFLGTVTGLYYITLGLFIPPLMAGGAASMAMLYFVCVWGFLGYFYSPLHLCQLLPLRQMGVRQAPLYREHLRLAAWLVPAAVLLYFVYLKLLG
ncbi:MAG TPA: DUF401 family protein [Candidatus Limnocylindria bacterium]|nr:DUF401 family protein [Candidatus Limnocylindria bacterium]